MSNKQHAPGAPGNKARWTYSDKDGIGKALDTFSQLTFTIGEGIINEVYFPREDNACLREAGFMVSDGKHFFSEEKQDTHHHIKMKKDGVPVYEISNECKHNRYRINKEVIADPFRNTVLQKVTFHPLDKHDYNLYLLVTPHLNNQGDNNNGWVGNYKGVPMLFAEAEGLALAVACTAGWKKRSVGFVGKSDGYTDVETHKTMAWEYEVADGGNIALTGEIDLAGSNSFIIALGFGHSHLEAANYAWGSLLDGFDSARRWYAGDWENWLKNLHNIKGKHSKTSAAVLRMNEAKAFPGGIIASMSIPWGHSKGDKDIAGYHLVWPRDLVESAGGFLALQTKNDALRVVNYLMSTQNADGSWPQNMWLSGDGHWKGIQMDQMALPLLLLDKCYKNKTIETARMHAYWPIAKKAINYLVKNGPYTGEDRWEEEKGLSGFTLAAEIAGLLAAGDLADANGEKKLGTFCRETADNWNDNIDRWTYVTGTGMADECKVDGYYIRLNPYYDVPANELNDRTINLKNHKGHEGVIKINELVSVDALALVRFGLRAADDPKILNTVKVIDAILKVDTPNGPCWHRYNKDGYGEHKDGSGYDGTGIGRAWPLLTGERGHYEVAAGNIAEAKRMLSAMDKFTNNGLLPEQIWDTDDIPEKRLFFGRPSGSAMPLTWAHAEYIKLCTSILEKKIFDMPPQTEERYLKHKTKSSHTIWRFVNPCKTISANKILRIEVMAEAVVCWSADDWQTTHETGTKDVGIDVFYADISAKGVSKQIDFTFFWKEVNRWENKNFTVRIEEPGA